MAKRNQRQNRKAILPNVFTALNILCGFLAITYIAREDPNFVRAAWLIVLAAVFDTLDGKIARITKSYSEFGIEFDSLADIVSFGVAPAVLIYNVYFHSYGDIGKLISFLPLLFGGIRLARFNIQISGFEKSDFVGMPIPASAVCLASFVVFTLEFKNPDAIYSKAFIPLVITVSFLMVSTIGYDTLPKFSLRRGTGNVVKLIFLLLSLTAISIFREFVLFPLIMVYILYGIVRWLICLSKNSQELLEANEE
ncbi:CDP-diacylglycerol--serine O-phosphatidyltransferase [candidate division KSB1 bacterium]|nr:CDP-diacylglycerol--serine O-phosphatidyltransferase [candidate division KSB1 bacterium]